MTVDNPSTIDFVATDPIGTVLLVMVEGREHDGSPERLQELEDKLNAYANYVIEGQLASDFPDTAGRPIRIELRCVDEPDEFTAKLIDFAKGRLEALGIDFQVRLIK